MGSTTHKRDVHIDAPVERVFEYVKVPEHLGRAFFITIHGVVTRQEYVPNERFVDHSSTGVTWTYTTAPDETGTMLSLACEVSSKVPVVDKVEDALFWKGDRELDKWLAAYKRAIEA